MIFHRRTSVLALLGLVLVTGLIWGWKHRAGSVDMALHYALAEYIRETMSWPTPSVAHMGEMNQYPPVSHTVAVIIGVPFGSAFLGLHLASTASAVIVLALLFVLVRFVSAGATLVATATFAAIMVGLQYTHAFLGREITGNFFYPQIFGQMCVFALVLIRSRLTLSIGTEIASAVGATFVLGWVYPIAAVQLAGAAVVWRALLMAREWFSSGRLGRDLLAFAILVVALTGAIALHPRFAAVQAQALNEGSVAVRIPAVLVIPATFALAALTAGLALEAVRQRLALRAPDAFVALCGGVAAASLAQAAAFFILGMGSRYGVYKHIYAVCTLLIGASIVAVVHFSRVGAAFETSSRTKRLAALAFVPAALIVLMANNVPWRGESLASIMRIETLLRSMVREHPDIRKHTVLLGGSRIAQFGFSMGILRLSKEISYALIYDTPERENASASGTPVIYALVATGRVGDPACALRSDQATRLTLVRYTCLGPAEKSGRN